ncbi:MAG: bifunctional riboflavin kinase/FAD synthetase [Armatimonadetes bacterium]|nr:bifunctional riboflavin kinase/FAD synthetase [Armatimonadota bacterium]
MLIHIGLELLEPEWSESVVCIGTFDGVHLGHQALLNQAVSMAKERECPSIALTFDRHPAAVLAPDRKPQSISTFDQDLRYLKESGVAATIILPFDLALANTTAQEFLDRILVGRLKCKQLVVGHDFALGKGREGTIEWLSSRIATHVVEPVLVEDTRVSSSAIRRAIAEADFPSVTRWLSRPYALHGVVVGGQKLGRTLGFPTINLAKSADQIVPPDGVYAGRAQTSRGEYVAAISVGCRPVVEGQNRTVEAYLLDYPGDSLYGKSVELEFWQKLRDEQNFPSLDDLKVQMARDVEQTKQIVR